jgi:hypothetical protein
MTRKGQGVLGDGRGVEYGNWGSAKIQGCLCDPGRFGPFCELRMCPKGDDPLTTGQQYRTIRIVTNMTDDSYMSGAILTGHYTLTFDGEQMQFSANASKTSAAVMERAFESLPNVLDAFVTRGPVSWLGGAAYTVQLRKFPELPHQNNIHSHSGNPPLSSFTCDVSRALGSETINTPNIRGNATCQISDVVSTNVREYEFCSRRGACDTSSGVCTCYPGYGSASCTELESFIDAKHADNDVILAHATNAAFSGNILRLRSEAAPNASHFTFLKA